MSILLQSYHVLRALHDPERISLEFRQHFATRNTLLYSYPVPQVVNLTQVNDPRVLSHRCDSRQLCTPVWHSLMSSHFTCTRLRSKISHSPEFPK